MHVVLKCAHPHQQWDFHFNSFDVAAASASTVMVILPFCMRFVTTTTTATINNKQRQKSAAYENKSIKSYNGSSFTILFFCCPMYVCTMYFTILVRIFTEYNVIEVKKSMGCDAMDGARESMESDGEK